MQDQSIYVRLMGGLGNQLFQYAAARSVADRLDLDLVIDDRYIIRKSQHTGLAVNQFNIRAKLAVPEEYRLFREPSIRVARWFRHQKRPLNNVLWELSLHYDAGIKYVGSAMLMCGFWQSERYFFDHGALRQDLQLKSSFDVRARDLISAVHSPSSIAVHIRRGDYLSHTKTFQRFGVCSQSYYQSAVDHMRQQIPEPQFIVFTDDMKWVHNYLDLGQDYIVGSELNLPPEQDLILMSLCQHQIIANSTFSWWSAWLNNYTEKIVVAPFPWFDDPNFADRDLIPSGWLRVNK
jgi:hypothetical protein